MMKHFVLGLALLAYSTIALADHTLDFAMQDNPSIGAAVHAIQAAAGVKCLPEDSNQSMPTSKLVKQVAPCYSGQGDGSQVGELSVTYQWHIGKTSVHAGKITKIEFAALN